MIESEKTPRFWSSRYWSRNNISDVLKEVVEPETVDVSSIKMNETLNPLIWESDEKIKSEVRNILLKNAKRFIEFSDVENLKFNDVMLTGSMANYNYNGIIRFSRFRIFFALIFIGLSVKPFMIMFIYTSQMINYTSINAKVYLSQTNCDLITSPIGDKDRSNNMAVFNPIYFESVAGDKDECLIKFF